MNREDIIRMAREAGIPTSEVVIKGNGTHLRSVDIERFAHLVASAKDAEHQQTLALQQRSYEREIEIEVEAEREACAKLAEATICDIHLPTGVRIYGTRVAESIRARSNT